MRLPRTPFIRAAHSAPSSSKRPRALLSVALVLAFVAAVAFGLSLVGNNSEANASAELALLREQAGTLLIYSEFGQRADTVWAADPSSPSNQAYVTTVEHSPGFGISASVSPDGAHLAYIALPPDAGWADAAQLWILALESGAATLLAKNVDLRTTPIWTPASDGVVVLRPDTESVQLLLVDLAGETSILVEDNAGLSPIGVTPDGAWLYYASLSERGTDLQRVATSGAGAEVLAHLGDGYSRDWHLAPDGSSLAYLGQTSGQSISYDARVYDVAAGIIEGAVAGLSGSQFNPIWHPNGGLTVGTAPGGEAAGAPVHVPASGSPDVAAVLAGSATGFDVPLSWSRDGVHLVLRHFEGSSATDPGPSHVIIVGPGGDRQQLSPSSDVLVAGWLD